MLIREHVARWLGILGAIAIFIAFQPDFRAQNGATADKEMADFFLANPGSFPFTEDYRFGLANSPLLGYHSERTVSKLPGAGYTMRQSSHYYIGWLSWSMLSLVVGVGLLWAGKRVRPPKSSKPKDVKAVAAPVN
jgi:hypothetical protein